MIYFILFCIICAYKWVKNMDDITESLKIIDNSVSNINGNSTFYSSSFIYKMANEDVSIYKDYLKNSRRILSVISSGDQIIESITSEKKVIDCFDISKYPNYYLMLKLAALKVLKKEDYVKLEKFSNMVLNFKHFEMTNLNNIEGCQILLTANDVVACKISCLPNHKYDIYSYYDIEKWLQFIDKQKVRM